MSVLDTMKAATPLVRRVTLCLDGALHAEYDALTSDLVDASFKDKNEQSLAAGNVARVARQMERVRAKMQGSEVAFSFVALPWFRFVSLQAEHPPRDGYLQDRAHGFNYETFPVALIKEACRSVQGADGKVVTEIPDDVWDQMFASLNHEQVMDVLYPCAVAANNNATTVPPSARSLLDSQDSGASSKSPGPGTSRPSGSKGGSRSGTRKSTATKKAASPA